MGLDQGEHSVRTSPVGGQGGEPLVKASFLALFATHVHNATAIGAPTTPPIPQGEAAKMTTVTTAK